MAVVNCPRECLEQWIAKQLKCFENIYLRKPLFCITRFFFHASAKSTSCTKDTREKHVGGRALLICLICIRVCDAVQGMVLGSCGFQGMQLYTYCTISRCGSVTY